MKKWTGRLVTAALIAVLVLPAACANDGGSSPTPSSPTVTSNRWLAMLKAIPASDNTQKTVYVQDHARLAERQAQYPAVAAVPEGVSTFMPFMQNNRFWNLRYYNDDEWQSKMGFVRADMDIEAFNMTPFLDQYQVIRGRFDRAKIEAALRSDPMNDDFQVMTYGGLECFSTGPDGQELGRRSNLRPLGYSLKLAVVDDHVFATNFARTMQEMVDAYHGKLKSLADLESYQLLSEGLVRLDAFAAIFSSESQAQSHMKDLFKDIIADPGTDGPRSIWAEQLQREVFLKPYQAFAVGQGLDEKGYYLAVVLVNADEATARDNAGLLEKQIRQSRYGDGQLWSDMITSTTVTREGRLALARLYGQAAFYWKAFDMNSGAEPLLMYKG